MKKRLLAIVALFVFVLLTIMPTVSAQEQETYGNSTIYVHDLGQL